MNRSEEKRRYLKKKYQNDVNFHRLVDYIRYGVRDERINPGDLNDIINLAMVLARDDELAELERIKEDTD